MPQLTIADFDFEGRVRIEERQRELLERNQSYVEHHPELQQCLHDLMEAVLMHKPEDPLAFIQDHVRRHREKNVSISTM